MEELPSDAALLLIDLQQGFADPVWGVRNNPEAEANVARLLAAWRRSGAPVIHVLHDSRLAESPLHPNAPGNAPMPIAAPEPGEPVHRKAVNCAFVGTDLEADLRVRGIETLVIVGLTTNHCVSTTARLAANLGFDVVVACDATAAFARTDAEGRLRTAQEVHSAALGDLNGEFARIASTDTLLTALARVVGEANSAKKRECA